MLRILSLALLLHLYMGLRLLPDLSSGAWAMALWLAASTALIPLALLARRMPSPRAERIAWAGFIAMGAFSSLLVLTLLRDLILLADAAAGMLFNAGLMQARIRSITAMAVPVVAGIMTLAGLVNARRRAAVRHITVPVSGLPATLDGFRIAQITDLHVGPTIRRNYVQAIVEAVNALDADLIAVTGDIVDGQVGHLARHVAPLSALRARHGVFFVTGNHEYYSGVHAWVAELRRLGLRALMNEHAVLHHDGASLIVAGVTDFSAAHFDPAQASDPATAMAGAPEDASFRMLLAHQPRSALKARGLGLHLQLSGHTHGGQFLPWNWFVRLQQPYTAGLHRLDDGWIYVSRGTGYWGPPKRLGAPSEITLLQFRAKIPE